MCVAAYICCLAKYTPYLRQVLATIGFDINKQQREELKAIVREMATMQFPHPQDPNVMLTFLPPGAGLGTLVKVAVNQYIALFAQKRAEIMAQKDPQAYQQAVAQAAVAKSQAMREGPAAWPTNPQGQQQAQVLQ